MFVQTRRYKRRGSEEAVQNGARSTAVASRPSYSRRNQQNKKSNMEGASLREQLLECQLENARLREEIEKLSD
eukprot:3848034-Prymnesium_polylepis.1